MKDFYAILGVDKSADDKEIKSSYRNLAKKYHPDKNSGDEEAAERFKEVSEAYSVLSDPQQRQQYDIMSSWNGPRTFNNSFEDLFSRFGFNPFDPFARDSHPPKRREPPSNKIPIELTFKELSEGGKKSSIKIRVTKKCHNCNGVGGDYAETCTSCAGTGHVSRLQQQGSMVIKTTHPCILCHKRGKLISGICHTCTGEGKIIVLEEYDIDIKVTKKL